MDFIIEFLAELILEMFFELAQWKKAPLWVRGVILGVSSALFIGLVIIIFSIDAIAAKIIAAALAVLFFVGFLRLWLKLWKDQKEFRKGKEEKSR